ncbi:unnamed protein product, partial [Polarella glacialis]
LVLHKPPGWEVDDAVEEARGCSIVSFLAALYPGRQWPLLRDVGFQFGLQHRLDVPSSGLLLVAKTYEAFFDLQLQLNLGVLVRDYVVLCHGWLSQARGIIEARVRWGDVLPGRTQPERSSISKFGKPAKTHIRLLAFSLLAIRISTGRRHQIRVHCAHVGNPIVCDGRYSAQQAVLTDQKWSPRNFLHRCRLEFQTRQGSTREVFEPLPADLTTALAQLEPRPGESSELSSKMPGTCVLALVCCCCC